MTPSVESPLPSLAEEHYEQGPSSISAIDQKFSALHHVRQAGNQRPEPRALTVRRPQFKFGTWCARVITLIIGGVLGGLNKRRRWRPQMRRKRARDVEQEDAKVTAG